MDSVVGRLFVEALNAGLARAASPYAGWRAGDPPEPQEPSDPFAVAVLSSFESALPSVLTAEERGDVSLRAALRLRGRQIMAEALLQTAHGPTVHGRNLTMPSGGAGGRLLPRHETLVLTLLIESAALRGLEGREVMGPAGRSAELVRTLGRLARKTQLPAVRR